MSQAGQMVSLEFGDVFDIEPGDLVREVAKGRIRTRVTIPQLDPAPPEE